MLDALTSTSQELLVGGLWVIQWQNLNFDGALVDQEPVITVTSPSGAVITPTATRTALGTYRLAVTVAVQGLHTAVVVGAGSGALAFGSYVRAVTTGPPDVEAIKAYAGANLGDGWTDEEIQSALDAEFAAQRARCTVGAIYHDDLAEALKRRVVVNLAKRGLTLASDMMGEAGSSVAPLYRDPEIARLENPHRIVRLGR